MARRDLGLIGVAVVLGASVGAAIMLLFGRLRDGGIAGFLLSGQGRWLAVAWLIAAATRGRWAAPVAGAAFMAALLGTAEAVPPIGVEAGIGDIGLSRSEVADIVDGYDRIDGGIDGALIVGGLVAGAAAGAWRHGGRWTKVAGVGFLCGALLLDGVDAYLTIEFSLLTEGPVVVGVGLVIQTLLALPAARWLARGDWLAALAVGAVVAALLIALPDYGIGSSLHPEIQVIK